MHPCWTLLNRDSQSPSSHVHSPSRGSDTGMGFCHVSYTDTDTDFIYRESTHWFDLILHPSLINSSTCSSLPPTTWPQCSWLSRLHYWKIDRSFFYSLLSVDIPVYQMVQQNRTPYLRAFRFLAFSRCLRWGPGTRRTLSGNQNGDDAKLWRLLTFWNGNVILNACRVLFANVVVGCTLNSEPFLLT